MTTTMLHPSSFTAEPALYHRERMAGVTPEDVDRSEQGISFWSVLAQKAKAVLLEDDVSHDSESVPLKKPDAQAKEQVPVLKQTPPPVKTNMGRPLQKSLDAIASSLSLLGDTLGTAIEEGLHLMETKTIGSPTTNKALQRSPSIWRKVENVRNSQQILKSDNTVPQSQSETQLRASRDVAMAMAAKAKLLLRELKTARADMSFLKDRCAQLEEENRSLREGANQGDDLVRAQLETLLAEKQRLAQENANYARENQFLHEVVEYHQLTLQDVALLDESLTGAAEEYSPRGNYQENYATSSSSSDDEHHMSHHQPYKNSNLRVYT